MYKELTNYKKQNFQIGYQCEVKHVEIDDFDTKKGYRILSDKQIYKT